MLTSVAAIMLIFSDYCTMVYLDVYSLLFLTLLGNYDEIVDLAIFIIFFFMQHIIFYLLR
jgi:hypothetical protein